MTDVVASWRGGRSSSVVAGRSEPLRGSAGYGVFRCRDGRYLTLAVIAEDHFWDVVCDALGIESLRGLSYERRNDRVEECNNAVAHAVASMSFDDALQALRATGAPVAPVLTAEEAVHPDGFPAKFANHQPRSRGATPEPDGDRFDPWR
jgi:crotonobetainyl-CoA:carnitine CoA-transferase CaiB-like acyl-CoA transferase